jgi:predicted membrane-bound spermidine synthase
MTEAATDIDAPRRGALFTAVVSSGAGGLLWEVLWQQRTAITLGASAFGAALTVASMMAGFATGGFLVARRARRGLARPLHAFGIAELVVGASALLVAPGLALLATLDTHVWAMSHALARATQLVGTALVLGVPSTAMGATLPLLAACAPAARTSIGRLYALNTLGAVLGILLATFLFVPLLGLTHTGLLAAAFDFGVALWAMRRREHASPERVEPGDAGRVPARGLALAFVSGLVIFLLEVAWFRAVHAAYQSSTETFGILLGAFLLPLSVGAALAPRLRRRVPHALPWVLAAAMFAVACTAPAMDQLDHYALMGNLLLLPAWRFLQLLVWVAVPLTLLGVVFPWLLEASPSARGAGTLYTANTVGAVLGALGAGFVLLPTIGATRTSWLASALLAIAGLALHASWRARVVSLGLAAFGLTIAIHFDSGGGRARVQGSASPRWGTPIFVAEGPDATVSVAEELGSGTRNLIIDGFEASTDSREAHYMRWMGHLPALAAGTVHDALVICFGTGQTADAVRQHRPQSLDIVDVSAAVLRAGPLFRANDHVLDDPVVHATVMDGRAFLRRARDRRYDLITLEPMPPNFAGVNNLYSREFYALARARLREHGIVAQWVPIHLLPPSHMVAVIATFLEAFPHSRLWIDPVEGTCILVGGTEPWHFSPSTIPLDLDAAAVERGILLEEAPLTALAQIGDIITDDNQLLAYGTERLMRFRWASSTGGPGLSDVNRAILARIAAGR